MRVAASIFLAFAVAQKDDMKGDMMNKGDMMGEEEGSNWWDNMQDDCMTATNSRQCNRRADEGCEWHEEELDKSVCYNKEFWKEMNTQYGTNTEDCEEIKNESECDGHCTWVSQKEVCYDAEGLKNRSEKEAGDGAGCWYLLDMDVCGETDGCVVDEGKRSGDEPKCRVDDGCWSFRQEGACKQNEMCTWIKGDCYGLQGLGTGGGECWQNGEETCGDQDGCMWLTMARGVGYCGRVDECRAMQGKDACDAKGAECMWTENIEVCRPADGVSCGSQWNEEECADHSQECIWAEHRGGDMRCMREDFLTDTRQTPCVQASDKASCDELPEEMNCGWTTEFGVMDAPLGVTGRCIHLSCSEIDDSEMCSANWQCNWDSRRQFCISDKGVVCDMPSRNQCETRDECRWVWSELQNQNFCQSVCLFHEVMADEHLCRSFPSCSWGSNSSGEWSCHIKSASADDVACRSAPDEFNCLQFDSEGAGCFWDAERNLCIHDSCETYETKDKCDGNFQCKWLGGRGVCSTAAAWWCNGVDEETCMTQPSCDWVTFQNSSGEMRTACRHECVSYETQAECINDMSCFWGASGGGPVGEGPRGTERCRTKAMDSDSSACAHQYTEKDCNTFAISASVGCRWEAGRFQTEVGQCYHEACYDYDSEETCDEDKYCKWITPGGRGRCASMSLYWCKANNEAECLSDGPECIWVQNRSETANYDCRAHCYEYTEESDCTSKDDCAWGVNGRGQNLCFWNHTGYDGGYVDDDACVDHGTEEDCLAAPEEDMCGWLEEADFLEGGEHEGRRPQAGCRHLGCFNYNTEEACAEALQCHWHNRRQECQSPVDYHCKYIEDKVRCNAIENCTWNGRTALRGNEYRWIENCTAQCRIYDEDECALVVGCGWVTAAHGFSTGQCMPEAEATVDQSYCNEIYEELQCLAAGPTLGCEWQYSSFFESYRCLHGACADAPTEEDCAQLYQCSWNARPGRPESEARCYAPRNNDVRSENPCRGSDEAACGELSNTCIWAFVDDTRGYRCLAKAADDGALCEEHEEQQECMDQPRTSQCVWTEQETCAHSGCRNNIAIEDCIMDESCEWVYRTASQLARYGADEGGWRCRSKAPCDPQTCVPPVCIERGTYLDPEIGCCGQCLPDECYLPSNQNKKSCNQSRNCKWNQKAKECKSKCPEVPQDTADRECHNDSLLRAIVTTDDGCEVPLCVRPEQHCPEIKKKKDCKNAGDGTLCEWQNNICTVAGAEIDCSSLDRAQCKDAKDVCLSVQKECFNIAAGCDEMDKKKDCKKLDKAHKKSNTGFKGCDWVMKLDSCMER